MPEWHGFKGNSKWDAPKLAAKSDKANRADQGNQILANEYLDKPHVLKEKVKMMANMIRQAKLCCAYTGAGLSRSSGIPDYATKASNSVVGNGPKLNSNLDALPTYAHCALTAMERAGYLHHYVQQNHDGLPQKSGFPQEKINEIHGAWYDPSNPVVQFSGSLRGDLFNWMIEMEKKIDLCLCLGTSLSGMNADRVAEKPAKRSMKEPNILGTIIINLQQTRLDDVCALRIWGKLDEVFDLLGKELGLGKIQPFVTFAPGGPTVFEVPYNEKGKLDRSCRMTLDLTTGREVFIPTKGASNQGAKGVVLGMKDNNCGYTIQLTEGDRFTRRILGVWWITAAVEGKVPTIPIINVNPVIRRVSDTNSINANANTTTVTNSLVNLDLTETSEKPTIAIVQSHEQIKGEGHNQHKWGLSIDASTAHMVAKVMWHLHPTFHPPTVSCTEAPFEISRLGWGTFVVGATIELKPEYGAMKLKAEHELTFSGGGKNVKTTLIPTR